ncbi:MAG: glycosyltransferase family 4 protein [Calothrix sp. C42_A2020_038]|nr:glycosyltransferase family 4 protein [Calothrix sp. C42_A2020_038]
MTNHSSSWICCQLGAREHYAIPRALHQSKQLTYLITDAWVSPKSRLNLLPKLFVANLRERYHQDLSQASIDSFTNSLICFELSQRFQKKSGWERMIARNAWFQKQALQSLRRISSSINYPPTLFAYSYTALNLFYYAKSQGWQTVLGQIDPGLLEEQLLVEEYEKYQVNKFYKSNFEVAPAKYWFDWQKECSLADRIIVNSLWSSQALQKVGVSKQKIDIIPLAYQPPQDAHNFIRTYPSSFSKERPLRVLFLGQIILRKGIFPLLEAAFILRNQPIEFWLVGYQGVDIPQYPQVKLIGSVSRSATAKYYQQADVFLFPTLSDGFGITQLEAQAWKLPVIASKFCGDVVKHGVNGILLEDVTANAIIQALELCLQNPWKLELFASKSTCDLNLFQLQEHLQKLSFVNHL